MRKWILILIIVFLSGCIEPAIKDLEVLESENNNHILTFNFKNPTKLLAECSASFSVKDTTKIIGMGIFQPDEQKLIESSVTFDEGKSKFTLTSKCEQPEKLEKCTSNSVYMQYFCLALLNQDSNFCEKIDINTKREWCKAYILDQPELCENIPEEEKDWCYMDIGMNKQDSKLCDKILDEGKKTSCIAVATSKPDLCLEGDEESKLICIENLAEFMKDITLCDKLGELISECYENMAWTQ